MASVLSRISQDEPEAAISVYILSSLKFCYDDRFLQFFKINLIYLRNTGFVRYLEVLIKCLIPILKCDTVLLACSGYIPLLIACVSKICRKRIVLRTSLIGYDDIDTISESYKLNLGPVFIRLMDAIICNSEIISSKYKSNKYVKKVLFIQNGVDTEFYKPVSGAISTRLREEYGIDVTKRIIVFSGAISERKNILFLIKVLNQLNQEQEDCYHLLLAGPQSKNKYLAFDENYYNEVIKMIDRYGLSTHVHFTYYDEPNANVYQMSDIYISVSNEEGMPNSVIEAMACGLPIVALNKDGNMNTLIRDNKNGFLIDTEDVARFTESIRKITENPHLSKQFSQESRRLAIKGYDISATANTYYKILNNRSKG